MGKVHLSNGKQWAGARCGAYYFSPRYGKDERLTLVASEITCGNCRRIAEKIKGQTCGTCTRFFRVYSDLRFGGCPGMGKNDRGYCDPDDLCSIGEYAFREQEAKSDA